jgi:hypothetical protein
MLLAEAALDYLIKHPAYIEVSFAQGSLVGWNYLSCCAQIILLGINEYIRVKNAIRELQFLRALS